MFRVIVNIDRYEETLEWWGTSFARLGENVIRDTVGEGVEMGAEYARQLHTYRDRTQALTASIRGTMIGDDEGVIESMLPYASNVEEGTPEHEIEPSTKLVLHWIDDDGEEHFARVVNHPGTKPMPFMQPAADAAGRYISKELDKRLGALLRSIIRTG